MASKRKLKSKVNQQRIKHKLEVSDFKIDLDILRTRLNFTEAQVRSLKNENSALKKTMSDKTPILIEEASIVETIIQANGN